MRAYKMTGPSRIEAMDMPEPTEVDLAEGQLLVRLRAGAICGSDMPNFLRGTMPDGSAAAGNPLHELVGDVLASASPGVAAGDRVVGWAPSNNALAQVLIVNSADVAVCSQDVPAHEIIVAQPLACVLYAVDRLPQVAGVRAAVIGLGPIGLLFSHVLSTRGARVTGVDPVDRSDLAAGFGVEELMTATGSDWASGLAEDDRPQVVVEAVGHHHETFADALDAVAIGGSVYIFGIPLLEDYTFDATAFLRKNLTLISGTTHIKQPYLREALEYLERFPDLCGGLVTNVMDGVQEAFELASFAAPGRFKVVLAESAVR